jgi:hypothetical protein
VINQVTRRTKTPQVCPMIVAGVAVPMVDLEADFLTLRAVDFDISLPRGQPISSASFASIVGGCFNLVANFCPIVGVFMFWFHETSIVK